MPRTKKSVGLRELRVGLLILGSIIVLIVLILNASGDINPFSSKIQLRARFSDANGVRPGSDVKLAGVRVGKVDDVRLLPPSPDPSAPKVEIFISVNSKIDGRPATDRIRTDSTAQQTTSSLLGSDALLNITPGTAAGQPVQENGLLNASPSQGSITDAAASVGDLSTRLGKVADQLNEVMLNIKNGKGTMGRLFNDEALYNNLNGTVRETQDLLRLIRTGEGSAGKFVNDPQLYDHANQITQQLNSIAEDIKAGRGTAGKLIEDDALYRRVNSIADRLDHSIDQINDIVADLKSGRGTIGKLLTDEAVYNDTRTAIARINTTTERLDNVVASAQRGEGTVGKLLTDDQLYSNVNQLSSESVKLLYDFRQNPKKYLTIKFQLF
jgi:phospholipid/cholesterol/gamma-HCH transport system substrate-binding protein